MEIREQIEGFLKVCLADGAYADCFVVELQCSPKGKIAVFVDSDEGITLARCQKISRALEQHIDAAGLFGGKYALEVSSPGTDRPLLLQRQYPKHTGRTLKVVMQDGAEIEGLFSEMKGETLYFAVPNGKGTVVEEISFENIKESFVQISFKKL